MPSTRLSAALHFSLARLTQLFARWVTLLGQYPALPFHHDVDAYVLLSQLRRRRRAGSCRGARGVLLPMPGCIDDAQVNIRITM
jgi:hypothetical protein